MILRPKAQYRTLLTQTDDSHHTEMVGPVSFNGHCINYKEVHRSDGTFYIELHFTTPYGPMVVKMDPIFDGTRRYIAGGNKFAKSQ